MARIPQRPVDIFPEVTEAFQQAFGQDLLSVILYGSGAGGDYIPGKSDLNFLVVLTERGIDEIGRALSAVKPLKKYPVDTPLLMTKAFIFASLDAYPLEFLDMKHNHILVFGEDVLNELSIDAHHLRLQCERELKAKVLHLRRGFLDGRGRARATRELIEVSLVAFIAIFRGLLYLKGVPVPQGRREIIRAVGEAFAFDPAVFLQCTDIREGVGRFSDSEIQSVFQTYLKAAGRLCERVDGMKY
jgi:hypothetical protein